MTSSGASMFRAYAPLLSQMTLAIVALLALNFAPPAQGKILLIPLTADARARLPAEIVQHEALLVGMGPFAGSLVVVENHQNLMIPMLRLGILALAAPPAGCGDLLPQAIPSR